MSRVLHRGPPDCRLFRSLSDLSELVVGVARPNLLHSVKRVVRFTHCVVPPYYATNRAILHLDAYRAHVAPRRVLVHYPANVKNNETECLVAPASAYFTERSETLCAYK